MSTTSTTGVALRYVGADVLYEFSHNFHISNKKQTEYMVILYLQNPKRSETL